MQNALASDLLERAKGASPRFFEHLVQLLVAMGYGGSMEDAAKAVGRSGDEGIDGGPARLDVIYLQAKRWEKIRWPPRHSAVCRGPSGTAGEEGRVHHHLHV